MKKNILFVIGCLHVLIAFSQQPLFDTHVHLWNGAKSVAEYEHQLDSTHQPVTRYAGILIARQGEPARTKEKNDELISLSKQHPNILPICSVHPLDGDTALNELKRISALGVKVIKLHPHTQKFDVTDSRVTKLCQLAGKLGVIVLMDNAAIKPGDCENLFDLAIHCDGTKFIFAHMGAFNFRFWNIIEVARTAKDFYKDNIYFDISASVVAMAGSPVAAEFVWTIRNAGIDHILLGSDYPQYSLKQAVDAFDKLDLTSEEKAKIRYSNAMRLFFPAGVVDKVH